jgi:hypothetical protein
MGLNTAVPTQGWNGDISEVRMWDRVRTAQEVEDYWDTKINDLLQDHLRSIYQYDEAAGTAAYNSVTNPWNNSGKAEKASSQWAQCPASDTVTTTDGDWVLGFWLTFHALGSVDGAQRWGLYEDGTEGLYLLQNASDEWYFRTLSGGSTTNYLVGSDLVPGRKYFMAIRSSEYDGEVTVWLRESGDEYDPGERDGFVTIDNGTGPTLNLGRCELFRTTAVLNHGGGQVAQVALFNTDLDYETMRGMTDRKLNGTESDLELLWNWETANPWDDQSGNGHDLTAIGATHQDDEGVFNGDTSWVGTGEGSFAIQGRKVPTITGKVRVVPLVEVDPHNWVWQICEGPIANFAKITEGGAALGGGGVSLSGNDIWGHSFGTEDYVYDLDTGLVRFASAPSFPPLAHDVSGDVTYTFDATAEGMMKAIGKRRAELVDGDFASFADIDGTTEMGLYTGLEAMTIIQAYSDIMGSIHGTWYMTDDEKVAAWQAPDLTEEHYMDEGYVVGGYVELGFEGTTFELNTNDFARNTFNMALKTIPPWRMTVGWGKHWATLATTDIPTSVSAEDREDLQQEYRQLIEEDKAIQDLHDQAEEVTINTLIYSEEDAKAETLALRERVMTYRYFYDGKLPLDKYENLREGDKGVLYGSRFDLKQGTLVAIISRQPNARTRTLSVRLWR